MLNTLLTPDVINIHASAKDWKHAVALACQPLLDNGSIEASYVDAIYKSHADLGPYYVVGPRIAMPHARPEDGVNRLSMSLTVIKEGVNFNADDNDPVYLLITLAATDSNSHVDAIANLAELFMNDEDVSAICNAQDNAEISAIIDKYQ